MIEAVRTDHGTCSCFVWYDIIVLEKNWYDLIFAAHEIYALLWYILNAHRILFQSFPKIQIELNHLLIFYRRSDKLNFIIYRGLKIIQEQFQISSIFNFFLFSCFSSYKSYLISSIPSSSFLSNNHFCFLRDLELFAMIPSINSCLPVRVEYREWIYHDLRERLRWTREKSFLKIPRNRQVLKMGKG